MKICTLLVVSSLVVAFASPSANAESGKGETRTIQAFAVGCALYTVDGLPVLKLNLYSTKEEALASKTSPKKPRMAVVLDFGPGFALLQLNPKSTVGQICVAIESQNAEKPIEIRTNAQNIVESVLAGSQDLKSDSFALMPPNKRQAVLSFLEALGAEEEQPEDQQQENPQENPQRAPSEPRIWQAGLKL